jgi:hypothetical protein
MTRVSPGAWAATGQQMHHGRVISDALLNALSEDGPLHGAIAWRNEDLWLRDVQLRKEPKGLAGSSDTSTSRDDPATLSCLSHRPRQIALKKPRHLPLKVTRRPGTNLISSFRSGILLRLSSLVLLRFEFVRPRVVRFVKSGWTHWTTRQPADLGRS